jgi:hypothetical protein
MDDLEEVARVVKQWLTLESENGPDAEKGPDSGSLYVTPDPDIAEAKQGLDGDIEPVREKFADLLFSGQMDWLAAEDGQLAEVLPQWFVEGSNDEYYLEQYATASRTDIKPVLTFLSGRLALWARGEAIPHQNLDYVEGSYPPGTQWYKWDGEQWLYSPTETGDDWRTMDDRAAAASAAPVEVVVDLSTPDAAQNAAQDVAVAAQDILTATLSEASAVGVSAERLKQLAVEALKGAAQEQAPGT